MERACICSLTSTGNFIINLQRHCQPALFSDVNCTSNKLQSRLFNNLRTRICFMCSTEFRDNLCKISMQDLNTRGKVVFKDNVIQEQQR